MNYETKQISSLDFDLPPERLAYENNELYLTLLKGNHEYWITTSLAGAIAIIDIATFTFTLADRFDIDTDPFDLVVRNGYIYVIPGPNQWEPISSYSRSSGLKVAESTQTIRFQSFAELNPVSDTIVTVDTDSSQRDMSLVNILDKLNNTITEYAYDVTKTFVPIATYYTDGPVSHLFYQSNLLIAVVGNSIIQIPLSLS